jgi:Rrf2 family protein
MKLSRTVTYALQATLQLARENPTEPVPCSRLAADGNMPERFLLQILRNLVNHGILRSTRGVEGGYSLQRPAHDISVLDIIEAIDGPMRDQPPVDEALSDQFAQRLRGELQRVTATARQQLQAIKLSQLIKPP